MLSYGVHRHYKVVSRPLGVFFGHCHGLVVIAHVAVSSAGHCGNIDNVAVSQVVVVSRFKDCGQA